MIGEILKKARGLNSCFFILTMTSILSNIGISSFSYINDF